VLFRSTIVIDTITIVAMMVLKEKAMTKRTSATTTKTTRPGFGALLRAHRKARHIGLVEFAQRIGLDPALLSRIETGKRTVPNPDVAHQCVTGLGIAEDSAEYRELSQSSLEDMIFGVGVRGQRTAEMDGVVAGPEPGQERSRQQPQSTVEFCSSLGDLIGRSTAYAVEGRATEITVRVKNGTSRRFQITERQEQD
jgi:transcriptional regulator with XRE-family HTH domain